MVNPTFDFLKACNVQATKTEIGRLIHLEKALKFLDECPQIIDKRLDAVMHLYEVEDYLQLDPDWLMAFIALNGQVGAPYAIFEDTIWEAQYLVNQIPLNKRLYEDFEYLIPIDNPDRFKIIEDLKAAGIEAVEDFF